MIFDIVMAIVVCCVFMIAIGVLFVIVTWIFDFFVKERKEK